MTIYLKKIDLGNNDNYKYRGTEAKMLPSFKIVSNGF